MKKPRTEDALSTSKGSPSRPHPGNRPSEPDAGEGCCDTFIHITNQDTINIFTCHPAVAEPTPTPEPTEPAPEGPPGLPPTGGCVPFALGSKPKKSLEQRLAPLLESTRVPSVLPAAFFQMTRRFLAGREPANALESSAFDVFRSMSPRVRAVMACSLETFDALSPDDRSRLFEPGVATDPDRPVDPDRLAELVADELLKRASLEAFGTEKCLGTESPGQVRVIDVGGEIGSVVNVNVCRINDLRTVSFQPRLALAEYTPEELQQVCTPEVEDGQVTVNCEVQTEPCPGHDVEGTCLRVPEVVAGGGVLLEGVNFFDVQTRVRLESQGETTIVREVETFVCGDAETPVTEEVDGRIRTIADCRVHDRLSFQVPADLPDGLYALTVVVPNNVGLEGFGDEFTSNPRQFVRVVPGSTATFQIASEQLDCVLETAAPVFRNAGSDEIGIKSIAVPVGLDLTPGEALEQNFEFGDVDTGEDRAMNRVLFQGSGISGVALSLVGFEIDNREAFEQEVRDYADAFVLIVRSSWDAVAGAVGTVGGLVALAVGLSQAWASAIAAGIALAINAFVALWAPADLVIEDAAAFSTLTLSGLTSVNFPAPPEKEFTSPGGIDVHVVPVSKGVQYVERREYRSDGEDSEYHITLRYNRL
ncbi:MAG: hypothetical protein PVI57_17345 [Gemmatimonadota bacterium]|jgi:hypothetical protein